MLQSLNYSKTNKIDGFNMDAFKCVFNNLLSKNINLDVQDKNIPTINEYSYIG